MERKILRIIRITFISLFFLQATILFSQESEDESVIVIDESSEDSEITSELPVGETVSETVDDQETEPEPETVDEPETEKEPEASTGEVSEADKTDVSVENKKKPELGDFHLYWNNSLIFILFSENSAFGFGGTLVFEYKFPMGLSLGLESGYYGAKNEVEINSEYSIVGGFSMIPVNGIVGFNFRITENLYLGPVLKLGFAYTNARISGWSGGSTFSFLFEGGAQVKATLGDGIFLQGSIRYIGIIESSGLVHMTSIGFGLGL